VQILVDGWGKPSVCDEGGVRSLQFNGGAVQSSMRVSAPFELDLSYNPDHDGLPGCSMPSRNTFCWSASVGARSRSIATASFRRHASRTLEINPDVIALRDEFLVPRDNERFQVVHTDACEYLARNDVHADIFCWMATMPKACRIAVRGVFLFQLLAGLECAGRIGCQSVGGESNRGIYLNRLRGSSTVACGGANPRQQHLIVSP